MISQAEFSLFASGQGGVVKWKARVPGRDILTDASIGGIRDVRGPFARCHAIIRFRCDSKSRHHGIPV